MNIALIASVWIIGALGIWFFIKHKYEGTSSEIYIPFPLIVLAIVLWPITLIVAIFAIIISAIVVLIRGDD